MTLEDHVNFMAALADLLDEIETLINQYAHRSAREPLDIDDAYVVKPDVPF